jgi:hypothetical protein
LARVAVAPSCARSRVRARRVARSAPAMSAAR